MPDRHSELPAHPDLEYYRKQAKHLLRSYEAGDAAARARAADVLGDRAAERFLLSDAQFVLAQEHGFRTWADFRADIQSHRATGDRPVVRLWAAPGSYASWADGLLTELRRGDPDALQRLRAQVPRYAAATDASAAELRDARLIIARELGFPTWRELMEAAEKSQRDDAERQEERRRMRPEAEALLAGDTARLAQLTPGQADTLLQMLAMRELLGTKLGEGLGVPRAAVDVLIGKATSLDLPLPQAIRSDRVEYVRLLLGAGADPGTRTDGITPLETAIYSGSARMVDLLAEHGIVPAALWTYAACGRLDLVRACFDADGRLRPDAALPRPNVAYFFPIPSRNPATDDPEEIMAEAFVHACQHGRTEVVRWFLDRGLNPDVAPYFGRTGLVWAVMSLQPEVVGLLMDRGADPARGGEMAPFGAEGMVAVLFATDRHDPVIRQLHELLKPRSAELPPQSPAGGVRPYTGRPARSAPCRNLQSATRSTRPS
jgi:Ankyrin repeats (many copies)